MKQQIIKFLGLISLIFFRNYGHSQIDFDVNNNNSTLYQKALKADNAIKKGDYGKVHSLIVVKDGELVFENYYNGWKRDSIHQAQSATKSIIATLLGIAIQQDFVKNQYESIGTYYSTYKDVTGEVKSIKIEDLLTQRHGFKWSEAPWNSPDNNWRNLLNFEGDWYHSILKTSLSEKPGNVFNYSNAAPTLVSGIVQNASKLSIDQFAKKYLFNELGINKYRFWQGNGGPSNNGMALVFLKPRDFAKIGQLYLQNGKWNDKQILPKEYVKKATSSVVIKAEGNPIYKHYDYGYFWWINPVNKKGEKFKTYMARGAGGQLIIVEPETNTVVAINAWNLRTPNRVQLIFDNYLSNNIK